jgi:hypothetical protein
LPKHMNIGPLRIPDRYCHKCGRKMHGKIRNEVELYDPATGKPIDKLTSSNKLVLTYKCTHHFFPVRVVLEQ